MSDEQRQPVILIFDDEADILELCTLILGSRGYKVFTCNNSNQAIEMAGSVCPDLILMDNWIPDIGGIEATRQLKAHSKFRHIPVIYFSANHDIPQLAAAAGADAYISKPFDIADLELVINRTLDRQRETPDLSVPA